MALRPLHTHTLMNKYITYIYNAGGIVTGNAIRPCMCHAWINRCSHLQIQHVRCSTRPKTTRTEIDFNSIYWCCFSIWTSENTFDRVFGWTLAWVWVALLSPAPMVESGNPGHWFSWRLKLEKSHSVQQTLWKPPWNTYDCPGLSRLDTSMYTDCWTNAAECHTRPSGWRTAAWDASGSTPSICSVRYIFRRCSIQKLKAQWEYSYRTTMKTSRLLIPASLWRQLFHRSSSQRLANVK